MMNKLIEHLESNTFDDQMYWVVPQLYTNKDFEIQWLKANRKAPWRFREKGQPDWNTFSNKQILEMLNKEKINLAMFEGYLRTAILQQAVFAHKLIIEVEQLLGKEKINCAIMENDRFVNELRDAILGASQKKTSINTSKENPFHVVKEP